MTKEQIELVFNSVAKLVQNNKEGLSVAVYQDILEETGIKHEELENILIFLKDEGLINCRAKVFNAVDVISLTHQGSRKFLYNT